MDAQAPPSGPAATARIAMEGIGAQARRSNQARVSQLTAALHRSSAGELSPLECQRSMEVAHQLVGSAGTFGYQRVSELGRQLESFFAGGAQGNAAQLAAAALALVHMQEDLASPAEASELS